MIGPRTILTDDGLVCEPLATPHHHRPRGHRPPNHHHPVNHALKARSHAHHCHHGHTHCVLDLGGPAGGSAGDAGGALEDAGGGGAFGGYGDAAGFGGGFGGGGSDGGAPFDAAFAGAYASSSTLVSIIINTGGGPCVPAPVPEISTAWMLLIGGAALFSVRMWRKHA